MMKKLDEVLLISIGLVNGRFRTLTYHSNSSLSTTGVALIEIVTDPDFGTSFQAAAFVDELATLLRHLRVCSANMSTGEMRVDINVSVGPSIHQQGSVVEVKNVNSLRAIRYAIGKASNYQELYGIHRYFSLENVFFYVGWLIKLTSLPLFVLPGTMVFPPVVLGFLDLLIASQGSSDLDSLLFVIMDAF